MTTRIENRFAKVRAEHRAALVTFVMGGDPDPESSMNLLNALPEAGADIIELGIPFSDPMADGPVIQAAGLRALAAGQTLIKTLALVTRFRQTDTETPIILMGYFNPIYIYGTEKFVSDAVAAGVDGLIVVDLPPEEDELRKPAAAAGLDFIFLATPTSDAARLPRIVEHASGFLYYVSVTGITGTRSAASADVATALKRLRSFTKLPIAVGFGIKTPENAAEVAKVADAVVVGSALVEKVRDNLDAMGRATPACVDAVLGFARELAEGVRSVAK